MPKGNPTAAQLWEGDVSFFSLDTDLIQGAGYNFDVGALKLLPLQLPDTMSLQLPEVVAQEIVSHRMIKVREAVQKLKSSSNELKRLASVEMLAIDENFEKLSVEATASKHFYQQITDYAQTCQGAILPIDGNLLADRLFQLYFKLRPPFAESKAKKSEFPDATSLLILEDFAKDNNTLGLIASADDGWSKFADESDYLYCVKSIEELATLFVATDAYAKDIEKRVFEAVQDDNSSLRDKLNDALVEHVAESEWCTSDVTSSTVARVEAVVYDKKLESYDIETTEVWAGDDKRSWVITLNVAVQVELHLEVEYFVWDSIDREEISLDADVVPIESSIEVEVFLKCSNVEAEGSQPEDWDIDIEIAKGLYECDQVDLEPDLGY